MAAIVDDDVEYIPIDVDSVLARERANKRNIKKYQLLILFLVIAIVIIIVVGVSLFDKQNAHYTVSTPSQTPSPSPLHIYYAGSLVDIMTRVIEPNFDSYNSQTITYITYSAASGILAKLISNGINYTDVFISASSKFDLQLMNTSFNHTEAVTWYLPWMTTRLGIAYSYSSPFVSIFEAVANGSLPWYKALNKTTMKIGRTDPNTDPKGYLTVILMKLAEKYYNTSSLITDILVSPNNPQQIFPEQSLENFLAEGALDVGFFYESEQQWGVTSGFISLPPELDFSEPSLDDYYSQVHDCCILSRGYPKHVRRLHILIPSPESHITDPP